jgi:hypothetical protein
MMRIKNELLGEQWAGVEVYPRANLVVDTDNIYHLWCTPRQLRVGWDDCGEYTVEHMFYVPKCGRGEGQAPTEAEAARLLETSLQIEQCVLEGEDCGSSGREMTPLAPVAGPHSRARETD